MQRWKGLVRCLSSFARCHQSHTGFSYSRLFPAQHPLYHLSFSRYIMSYNTVERGCLNTFDYRIFFTDGEGRPISPFHDIPLYSNESKKEFNMVVEIPRWTNHKMEINIDEKMNPIRQDIKKGAVRFVKNCFPHHGYIWNYGALPQTFEDPDHVTPETGTKGDGDPLDVCEIGQKVHKRGAVIQVKVLGVMCLIDEGETDWKIICIDVTDPLAEQLNDIDDIEKHMPGFVKATREWFTIYKIPDGKPANKFAFAGEAKDKAYALNVIEETHEQWQKLVSDADMKRDGLCCVNACVEGSPFKVDPDTTKNIAEGSAPVGVAADLPTDVDRWHYASL